jgi:hypothetical protein
MDIKTSFFDVMSEVKKDLEDISAGIGQFKKNLIYKNFVWILTSKLARSTLTRLVGLGLTVKYFMPIRTEQFVYICMRVGCTVKAELKRRNRPS